MLKSTFFYYYKIYYTDFLLFILSGNYLLKLIIQITLFNYINGKIYTSLNFHLIVYLYY